MSDRWQIFKDKYEHTFIRFNAIPEECKALNFDQIQDLIEHAANQIKRIKTYTEFADSAFELNKAEDVIVDSVGILEKTLETGKNIVADARSACDVFEAVSVLNDYLTPNSKTNTQDAAKALDKLFGGMAHFFEKLPFPANYYARTLAEIGTYSFFSHTLDLMDPMSPNTPNGRRMREAVGP